MGPETKGADLDDCHQIHNSGRREGHCNITAFHGRGDVLRAEVCLLIVL